MKTLTKSDLERIKLKGKVTSKKPEPIKEPEAVNKTGSSDESVAVIAIAKSVLQAVDAIKIQQIQTSQVLEIATQPGKKKKAKFTVVRDTRGFTQTVLMEEL